MTAPVLVVGAAGRLGAFACEVLERSDEFEVAARWGRAETARGDWAEFEGALGLDLTEAGVGYEHARRMLEHGLRPVVGTSGVTRDEAARLDELARARGLGGLVVPNFSLGLAALRRAARELARAFPSLAITETHRPEKKDAPSATALDLRAGLVGRLGRREEEVPIRSERRAGVLARHELDFTGGGERASLSHEVTSQEAYAPGILLALHWAATSTGVGWGLEDVLAESAGSSAPG